MTKYLLFLATCYTSGESLLSSLSAEPALVKLTCIVYNVIGILLLLKARLAVLGTAKYPPLESPELVSSCQTAEEGPVTCAGLQLLAALMSRSLAAADSGRLAPAPESTSKPCQIHAHHRPQYTRHTP